MQTALESASRVKAVLRSPMTSRRRDRPPMTSHRPRATDPPQRIEHRDLWQGEEMPEAPSSTFARTARHRISPGGLPRLALEGHSAGLRFAEPRFNQHHIAGLHRQLQQAQIDVIIGLLSALQAKDAYTHYHSIRVSILVDRFAERLRLSP